MFKGKQLSMGVSESINAILAEHHVNPAKGLGDELFVAVSALVPIVNVDLLVCIFLLLNLANRKKLITFASSIENMNYGNNSSVSRNC